MVVGLQGSDVDWSISFVVESDVMDPVGVGVGNTGAVVCTSGEGDRLMVPGATGGASGGGSVLSISSLLYTICPHIRQCSTAMCVMR